MDTETLYHFYKPDFLSAYNNNKHNIEMALTQVSTLREISVDKLRTILKPLLLEYRKKEVESISREFPSLCYDCVNGRKPATTEVLRNGYTGCAEFTRKEHTRFVKESDTLMEGWVDLRSDISGEKSGITTNLQMLARKVTSCDCFQKK